VLRLVEPDFAAAGEGDGGKSSPALFMDRAALDFARAQGLHRGLQVIAHEVEFVLVVLFVWMERDLGRRERKNQPAVAGVDRSKFENVSKKPAVGLRVFAVDNDMSTSDHSDLEENV
jgi:hypothetical protein